MIGTTSQARGRVVGAVAAAACAALLLASCSTDPQADSTPAPTPTADLSAYYQQALTWTKCEGGQCATFKVPLDYANPDAEQISINVFKSPASDPNARRGALVVNPGGPGGSGIDFAKYGYATFSGQLLREFDIIGFDPRGVVSSTPIECLDGPGTDQLLATLGTPQNEAQTQAAIASAASVGQACEANSPNLTPHIGTVPAARDMDILRELLSEPKLNYMGLSYGTFLGLTYADLFTNNVGRFVLDGVIAPDLTNDQLARGQAEGFQLALSRFVADCPNYANCPLPNNPVKATAKINRFLVAVGNEPIKGIGPRKLTRPLAANAIIASFYEPQNGWRDLRISLRAAFQGNGTPMLRTVDSFSGRLPNGTYADNSVQALYAVNCLDRGDRADPATTEQLATQWSQTAPTFGSELAWSNLPCYDWPAPATDSPKVITAEGAPPILLVGTTYDPATPYVWAKEVNDQLASSVLVTFEGDGHTGYSRNNCVTKIVDEALLEGTLPAGDSACT